MKVFTLRRVVLSLVFAVAGALLVVAATLHEETPTLVPNDEAVIDVVPEQNSVLNIRQTEVVVQLGLDYELDALLINRTAVGGDELVHVPATNRYGYTPGDGKTIEQFPEGRNCVTAEFHEVGRSVESGRTYTWCFQLH